MERNPTLLIWYNVPETGKPRPIDGVCTDDSGVQRGLYSGETLTDIGRRYPNPVITEYAEFQTAHELAYSTKPARITGERFDEMLNVLPPYGYHHSAGFECFKMVERISGNMTDIFARFNTEYWHFVGRDTMSTTEIQAAILAARHKQ